MKVKKWILCLLSLVLLSACSLDFIDDISFDDDEEDGGIIDADREEFLRYDKTITYCSSMRCIIEDEEIVDNEENLVREMVSVSNEYFRGNGLSYHEICDDSLNICVSDSTDSRIAVVAMALAEYDLMCHCKTRTSIGGCVLEAIGVRGLLNDRCTKKVALKIISKAVLKRSIPYIGWGLTAVDFGLCMFE